MSIGDRGINLNLIGDSGINLNDEPFIPSVEFLPSADLILVLNPAIPSSFSSSIGLLVFLFSGFSVGDEEREDKPNQQSTRRYSARGRTSWSSSSLRGMPSQCSTLLTFPKELEITLQKESPSRRRPMARA